MREGIAALLTQLNAVVDSLTAFPLDSLTDDELMDVVRATETTVRRLAPISYAQTAELDRRGLAFGFGCTDTKTLAQLLRLSRPEAKARVIAAERFAERRAVSGEPLEALLPAVAAAQVEGAISPKHAAMIGDTIDKLPAAVDEAGEVAGIETFLVEQARQFPPETLAKVCHQLIETIDPDGVLRDVKYRDRRRSFTMHRRPDGSVTGTFDGTAEFGEVLQTVLDVTAAPKPAADGARDDRSVDQRNHDGLLDALRLVIRAKQLPSANGVVATVVLTMTAEQWASEQGLARTGHGALVPVSEATRIAGGDARLFPVVLDPPGGAPPPVLRSLRSISAYGSCHRIFTERERLAMSARDGGCTFPGCTAPPAWCEADHVTDWKNTGRTSVDDGHLACPQYHRDKVRNGWTVLMLDAIPRWLAPAWLDPSPTPQRNHAHDPVGVS